MLLNTLAVFEAPTALLSSWLDGPFDFFGDPAPTGPFPSDSSSALRFPLLLVRA